MSIVGQKIHWKQHYYAIPALEILLGLEFSIFTRTPYLCTVVQSCAWNCPYLHRLHICVFIPVVQSRITAYWFRDKELAMAFGITLAFSRLGSVLNFFLTQSFEQEYGLVWTLWGGELF